MATPSPPSRRGRILGNPFVLGAGALVIAIATAVGVAIALGRGGPDSVTIVPTQSETLSTATPPSTTEAQGLRAKAATTLTVRAGPGIGFISLGVVAKGTEMEVVAKSDGEQWLEVIYPPRSRLKGWVQLDDVEFSGDLAALPVGGAEVFALPTVPTSLPTEVPEEVVTVEATPENLLPDLTPSDAFVAGESLIVTVTNNGEHMAAQVIDVAIYDASVSQVLKAVQTEPISLTSGESIDISTNFQVEESASRRIVIVVNAGQTVEEGDYSNNSLVFVVSGAVPTETPEEEVPTATATAAPTGHPLLPTSTPAPVATETPTASEP